MSLLLLLLAAAEQADCCSTRGPADLTRDNKLRKKRKGEPQAALHTARAGLWSMSGTGFWVDDRHCWVGKIPNARLDRGELRPMTLTNTATRYKAL